MDGAHETRDGLGYRALVENAGDPILAFDTGAWRVLEANRAACGLWGVPRASLLGVAVRDLFDAESFDRVVDAAAHGDERCEVRVIGVDGERVLELSCSPATFAGRVALVAVARDVTEHRLHARALMESERRFRDLLGSIRLLSVVLDAQGRVTFCNAHLLAVTGYTREELLGEDWFERTAAPTDGEGLRRFYLQNIRAGTIPAHHQDALMTKAGERRNVAWSHTVLRDTDGRIVGTASLGEDVTERKRAEDRLRESEERYALAARGANDGLWDWDLARKSVFYSERWREMVGVSAQEAGDGPEAWLDRVHPEDVGALEQDLAAHLEGRAPHFDSEFRLSTQGGGWRWFLARGLAVRDAEGTPTRIAGSLTDVTDRKLAERRALHEALTDSLTGLPNRNKLMERLDRALKRHHRLQGTRFAVLLLDLDRFKVVNDSLGHQVGDTLLVEIAKRVRSALTVEDTLARLGGDEFCVLLEDIADLSEAVRCADRIKQRLARPFDVAGNEIFVTASIGIALNDPMHRVVEDILRDADTAMYKAKANGRARHSVFHPSMHQRAFTLLQLQNGLRRALERGELAVHYQPIVEIPTGRIKGFEALVRWPRWGGRPVSPAEFIPVAEDTGLIVPLGRWVLQQSVRQLHAWRQRFPAHKTLTVSVNLSVRQILQDDVIGMVGRALRETGLAGDALTLEVTESVLSEDVGAIIDVLTRLRTLKVKSCIDDFGTGYSSLSLLHKLPVDALKIDKSFVDKLADGGAIVRTIIELAHGLGMAVVAEGVETPDQLERLRAWKCEYAQGYLLSRPMSAGEAERALAGWKA